VAWAVCWGAVEEEAATPRYLGAEKTYAKYSKSAAFSRFFVSFCAISSLELASTRVPSFHSN